MTASITPTLCSALRRRRVVARSTPSASLTPVSASPLLVARRRRAAARSTPSASLPPVSVSPLLVARRRRASATAVVVSTLTLRQALSAALLDDQGVAAIVGTYVFFQRIPEADQLPAITFRVVSNDRGYRLSGKDGTSDAHVSVTSWSKDPSVCEAASLAVQAVLAGFSGLLAGSLPVMGCWYDDEADSVETQDDGTDRPTYGVEQVFRLIYRES